LRDLWIGHHDERPGNNQGRGRRRITFQSHLGRVQALVVAKQPVTDPPSTRRGRRATGALRDKPLPAGLGLGGGGNGRDFNAKCADQAATQIYHDQRAEFDATQTLTLALASRTRGGATPLTERHDSPGFRKRNNITIKYRRGQRRHLRGLWGAGWCPTGPIAVAAWEIIFQRKRILPAFDHHDHNGGATGKPSGHGAGGGDHQHAHARARQEITIGAWGDAPTRVERNHLGKPMALLNTRSNFGFRSTVKGRQRDTS